MLLCCMLLVATSSVEHCYGRRSTFNMHCRYSFCEILRVHTKACLECLASIASTACTIFSAFTHQLGNKWDNRCNGKSLS